MKKPLSWSVVPPILLLMFIALLLLWQVIRVTAAQKWVNHTNQVIAQGRLLENNLANGETGVQGYVITGSSEFLEQYENALAPVEQSIQSLRRLTLDNPSQTQRIDALHRDINENLLSSFRAIVDLKRKGKNVANLVRAKIGRDAREATRTKIGEILAIEDRLRTERLAATARETQNTILAAAVSFVLIGFFLTRNLFLQRRWEGALQEGEDRYRAITENVRDYAIFILDPNGYVATWSKGAEQIKGYKPGEIIGQHFSRFYPPDVVRSGKPEMELRVARAEGRYEDEGWRIRKDGSRFWANVVITALIDQNGRQTGFLKITRDLTQRKLFESELQYKNAALAAANKELEAFSYSVSHDLRAPLRSTDGFSIALLEEYSDKLDDQAKDYLHRIRASSQRMGQLIDDLLSLSRLTRKEMTVEKVDLTQLVRETAEELQNSDSSRKAKFIIADEIIVDADRELLRVVVSNLLNNAWKFTSKHPSATIEFGATERGGMPVYFVRDDGAGFDMAYAQKLFGAFQRLHRPTEFPGTGVGLATVQRIVHRHGGLVWAEGQVEKGATFYFTLGSEITKKGELSKEKAA